MRFRLTLVLILLLILVVSGCGKKETGQLREDAASAATGDIVIGAAWPFEDQNDLFSEGIDLALQEINSSGGVLGRKLSLVKEDDHSSVTLGMSIAQRFAENLDMVAVIAHRSSVVAVPASSIYAKAGLVMISPGATAPKLTQKQYKTVFRNIPSDQSIADRMARFARSAGYRNMAIFYADDEYGRGLANAFEDGAAANGIGIIDRMSFYEDATELKRVAAMWKTLHIDAVFVADVMPSGAEFIKKLRETGLNVPILGGDGLDSERLIEIAGSDAEGTIVPAIFNPDDPRKQTQQFVEKFKSRYQTVPGKWAAQGYDAVRLLAEAIRKSGSTAPSQIAEALRTLKDWPGAAGNLTFSQTGDVENQQVVMKIVRDGRFEYVK